MVLAVLDACICFASMVLAFILHFYNLRILASTTYLKLIIFVIPVCFLLYKYFELHDSFRHKTLLSEIGKVIQANFIGVILFSCFFSFWKKFTFPEWSFYCSEFWIPCWLLYAVLHFTSCWGIWEPRAIIWNMLRSVKMDNDGSDMTTWGTKMMTGARSLAHSSANAALSHSF